MFVSILVIHFIAMCVPSSPVNIIQLETISVGRSGRWKTLQQPPRPKMAYSSVSHKVRGHQKGFHVSLKLQACSYKFGVQKQEKWPNLLWALATNNLCWWIPPSSVAHKIDRTPERVSSPAQISSLLQHMVKAVALDLTINIARICPFQEVLPICSSWGEPTQNC